MRVILKDDNLNQVVYNHSPTKRLRNNNPNSCFIFGRL